MIYFLFLLHPSYAPLPDYRLILLIIFYYDFYSKKAFESFKCMDIKGEDGLVEARHIYPVFRSSEETRPWATLGFQLGKFRISYRIRNWSTNIFKIS